MKFKKMVLAIGVIFIMGPTFAVTNAVQTEVVVTSPIEEGGVAEREPEADPAIDTPATDREESKIDRETDLQDAPFEEQPKEEDPLAEGGEE